MSAAARAAASDAINAMGTWRESDAIMPADAVAEVDEDEEIDDVVECKFEAELGVIVVTVTIGGTEENDKVVVSEVAEDAG
jgi:hypothetical protein